MFAPRVAKTQAAANPAPIARNAPRANHPPSAAAASVAWEFTNTPPTRDSVLPGFPHRQTIAHAFGLPDFTAPASIDPAIRAEAATQDGHVRFARWPSLEVAAHEVAHVIQNRNIGRRTSEPEAEDHAASVAGRLRRGLGARDLLRPGALVSAETNAPQFFVPAGEKPATHTVTPGETWEGISEDVYGDKQYAPAIRNENKGVAKLEPGKEIALPEQPDFLDPWANPYVSKLLRKGGAWTKAQAEAALVAFAILPPTFREDVIRHYLPFNHIVVMLRALSGKDTEAGGKFQHEVRDLLEHLQRAGAQIDAAAQGLKSENAMAKADADFMTGRDTATAKASLPPGKTPTKDDLDNAHRANVMGKPAAGVNSGAGTKPALTPEREKAINNTLNTKSIPKFVTWAKDNHGNLGIKKENLLADARAVFDAGPQTIAFAKSGELVGVVGEMFMDMVARDPAYAMPTLMHEVWGHHTYDGMDAIDKPGRWYGLDLYDKAAKKMGYQNRGDADRRDEQQAYSYPETEIYSLMREVPYYKPNKKEDEKALGTINYDPMRQVKRELTQMKSSFEPRVARAQVRGLHLRLVNDPTIDGPALDGFRGCVRTIFPADAKAILGE